MLTNSFACIPIKSILEGWKKILQTTLYGHKNLKIHWKEKATGLLVCLSVGSPGHWMEGNRKGHQDRLGHLGLQKWLQDLGFIYAKCSISYKKTDSVCLEIHTVPHLLLKLLFLSSRATRTFACKVSEFQIGKSRHNPLLHFHLKIIKSSRVF